MNILKLFFWVTLILLLAGCKREFDSNTDFSEDVPAEVYGDNQLLFSKIFRFNTGGAYLWFDIRNEIANFSKPSIGLSYEQNEIARYKLIDLRGMLYRYDSQGEELTVLDYPLDILTGTDSPADVVFHFARKQKDGCELLTDAAQRNTCERTFVLAINRIVFKEPSVTLPVGTPTNYADKSVTINNLSQEILLTN